MRTKVELSEEEINSIAQLLDCGSTVYYNIETGEQNEILEENDDFLDMEELEPELKNIRENPEKYIEFVKMDSNDSFRVMENFISTVEDVSLRQELQESLRRSKPFRNFKNIIDNSEIREKWFEFKNDSYMEFVRDQLDAYNFSAENG